MVTPWASCRIIIYSTTLVLLVFLLPQVYSFCPSICTCEGDPNMRTWCIGAGLDVVPIQLNPEVRYINLTANRITNVHFTLTFYNKLELLDLSLNRIEALGSRNFDTQEHLRALNLSGNAIATIPKDALRGLKRLQTLRLGNNRIETLHPAAFHDLRNLIELDLTGNALTSLEPGTLRHLYSLEVLSFQNNQLLEVPYERNLEHLGRLQLLDLSVNLLEYIGNDSFVGLRELRTLRLGGNILTELDVGAFHGLTGLKALDVVDNNFTVVPTLQLSKLCNLTYLSLSGNYFTALPPVAFLNLVQLQQLHLDRLDRLERIDVRAFVDNANLRILTLDDNPSFASLPLRLFHGNPVLTEVSVRRNALVRLDAVHFPLDRLERLELAGNPLVCNCSLLWLWRLATGYGLQDEADFRLIVPAAAAATAALITSSSPQDEPHHHHHRQGALHIDRDEIGCDWYEDGRRTRHLLRTLAEADMHCPTHLLTVVSAVLSVLLVLATGGSVLYVLRQSKRRKRLLMADEDDVRRTKSGGGLGTADRSLPHPQKVDKLELERYLAQQQSLVHEYRALRAPWELGGALPVKEDLSKYGSVTNRMATGAGPQTTTDHYESLDFYQQQQQQQQPQQQQQKRTLSRPHIVFV
ncbi:insulin-like growth factor-binding protein complex acid labile subunit [Anopheles bellator]|uniref:insulin-like growth factor-binding protein complex acid labile subunit n=1 Tax=Anopheles bellator TaxID=139047 RepID=UPI002649E8A0|nr:insulin-like growth factor-binding protein complex acid labile subunit [Anopheles bellator]